jgi:hypothetical protein
MVLPAVADEVLILVWMNIEVEVEVKLRPTVSRPRLGVRHPSETRDNFFFLLEISFRQLACLLFRSALSDERTGL